MASLFGGLHAALMLLGAVTVQAQTSIAPYGNYSNPSNNTMPSIVVDNCLPYVDQFIGTSNYGDVFGGATLPYGMAKPVADVTGQDEGGYGSDGSPVQGFSHMHDSGTGGNPSLGDFPLFPFSSCKNDTIDGCAFYFPKQRRPQTIVNNTVKGSPGYFALQLNSSISAEMTATQHTALYRFTFPKTPGYPAPDSPLSPVFSVDLSDLQNSRYNGSVSVDPTTGRMQGNATFNPSFGSGTYNAYFCADFEGAPVRDTGIWVNDRAGTEPKDLFITRGINGFPLPGGSWIRFECPTTSDNSIVARVGVSFISNAQACASAESEIPNFDFEGTRQAAQSAWEEKLSPFKITTGGVSDSFIVNFCSGIYRTLINPQDYTGENPYWQSPAPYFDSFYCIWDEFRAQFPLLTVFDPKQMSRIVQALINIYEHQGWLPDCHMSLCKGYTQGGSNADVVLADAYVKGLPGIDWQTGYAAVKKDAEVEPTDWSNEGRGGLMSWKSLGYIPAEDFDYIGFGTMTRSVSRTLEYAYDDFCVAQIARGLGNYADNEKYAARSENWKNIWNPAQTSYINSTNTGFVGFPQPRFMNGTWGFQAPTFCSNLPEDVNDTCSLQNNAGETFESSIWEYQFFVPGDMAAFIATVGGPQAFVNRLNFLHDSNITYIGNEPAFLTVFQYHYAGRPAESTRRSHFYIPSQFATTAFGLPGNDDSGALGSFIAFNMMGLFPNPGQNVYLISSPYFESVSVTSPLTNNTATVRAVNFDPTFETIFIQSATLNGKPYYKNWIDHSFFINGGELVLTLGRNESAWGTRPQDLPPSLSTGGCWYDHQSGWN